ncbi:MAG: hypothetical protein QXE79_02220 [Candidatus Bathyarchaeia archaeon]
MPLKELHLHEETIPELVEKLSKEIEVMSILKNPVIVDDRYRVVLDGTHRVEALEEIGCTYIAACTLDYFSHRVIVGRWFRVSQFAGFEEAAKRTLRHLGYRSSEASLESALNELDSRDAACWLLSKGKSLRVSCGEGCSLADKLNKVKMIEGELRSLGCTIEYAIEGEALDKLIGGIVDGVLTLPHIEKMDVIEYALKGHRFPMKTTRHVVPARPWNINIPLSLLKGEGRTLEEANKLFLRLIKRKQIRVIPPGSILDGRKYEEEVYEFVDSRGGGDSK